MSILPQDAHVLTVSQLSNAIKHCLENTFPLVWLQGEISNCKLHSSGHLYFSLKDPYAQISAVMFRSDAIALKTIPKDGMQVIVRGEINVYPQGGKYQILVREIRPVGMGELLLKLEELKIKLHKKGWFLSEHKKPLPKFPNKIGVVTSPTGAAIQDILNILKRRFSGFHLILNPVRVQGEGAAQEIAQAIAQFNHYNLVDVMIVGRGGGSIEDLWAFNEEIVAEAIFHSLIPVISAVGHETDHCIADYVADVRAPTPSAAAELVIAEKTHQLQHLTQVQKRASQTVKQLIRKDRSRLEGIKKQPILQSAYGILGLWMQRLDALRQDFDQAMQQRIGQSKFILHAREKQLYALRPMTQLVHLRQKLVYWDKNLRSSCLTRLQSMRAMLRRASDNVGQSWQAAQQRRRGLFSKALKFRQMDAAWQRIKQSHENQLEATKSALYAIDPKNLLTKGYCILFSEKDHSAITSIHAVEKHQNVRVMMSDGELLAIINDILPK
jgi:exodeoxyribonuclease VII large subunit